MWKYFQASQVTFQLLLFLGFLFFPPHLGITRINLSFPFPHLWFCASTSFVLVTADGRDMGQSDQEEPLISWILLAQIIFMAALLFAGYIVAAHILVNNNLDNLKKFIAGYRCWLFCWKTVKNSREENCCQTGL